MTTWLPELDRFPGPRYLAIAEALASDVRAGRLAVGARLPTHRDLAWRLKVTIGTVTRAYNEAERRASSPARSGAAPSCGPPEASRRRALLPPRHAEAAGFIDLSVNTPVTVASRCSSPRRSLIGVGSAPRRPAALPAQCGRAVDREAGAHGSPQRPCLEPGAHRRHRRRAARAHRRTRGADAIGRHARGRVPELSRPQGARQPPQFAAGAARHRQGRRAADALEAACRSGRSKPSIRCRRCTTDDGILSEARRALSPEIAARHGVAIVEDDVYGFLLEAAPAPIAASHRNSLLCHVDSRASRRACASAMSMRPSARSTASPQQCARPTYMATPLMAEIASRWIRSAPPTLVAEKRQGARRRQRLLGEILAAPASAPIRRRSTPGSACPRNGGRGFRRLGAQAGVGVTPPPPSPSVARRHQRDPRFARRTGR